MEIIYFLITAIAGFFGAFFGVMAGGGSLITLPILMVFLPPQIAIATNRLGIIFATASATVSYHKRKVFKWKTALPIAIAAVVGGFVGSNILLTINEALLGKIISVMLIAIVMFLLVSKKGYKPMKNPNMVLAYFFAFLVGVYSGFFGPGTGTFYMAILVMFFGFDFLHAAGTKSFLTFSASIMAVAVFIYSGLINYPIGITLAVSMTIGGWMGAKVAVKKGNKFIKILFTIISLVIAVNLLMM